MESARARLTRRSPRRGSIGRPINTRLIRTASVLLVFPLVLIGLTVARPGPLPAPQLPTTFDGASAALLARELALDYPNRLPGTGGGLRAADWYRDRLSLYALPITVDGWREHVPGLGTRQLRNIVSVVPGRVRAAIVVMAHRDNPGRTPGANDNASGTAALIELARMYGTSGAALEPVRPLHTLVFVSTDAGAFGGLGARRFARTWRGRESVVAAVVLDGLATSARPRITVGGAAGRSPSPALVRTVTARVEEVTGREPIRSGWLDQLVALGLRFGEGEEAALLAAGLSAVRLGNAVHTRQSSELDNAGVVRPLEIGRLGRAAQASLISLDQAVGVSGGTAAHVFVGSRALRGWAIALFLATAIVPFAACVFDLAARLRRRGVSSLPALRALRRRLAFWLFALAVLFVASYAGVFPRSRSDLPLPPTAPAVSDWPIVGLLLVAAVLLLAWLWSRSRLRPTRAADEEQELAGQVAALLLLAAVAAMTAVVHPYALVFVLPSLASWLWLPQLRLAHGWVRDVVYGIGLIGPMLAVVTLAVQLDLGPRVGLYALSLLTSGVVPWPLAIALAGWAAAAAQLGAVQAGRYTPRASRG
jgi:hypothetical protein